MATGARGRLRCRDVAPLRRDRGHDDRRPGGRDQLRPDQDGRAVAHRPRREVQPAAPDRGGARRPRGLSRLGRLSSRSSASAVPGGRYAGTVAEAAPRRTKIVATIGPACSTPEALSALAQAGMDAARFNFSHGTHDQHASGRGMVRGSQERARAPDRADRRPAGPEAPHRRPRRADDAAPRRGDRRRPAEGSTDGELPVSPAVIGEVLQPGPRRADRRRARAAARRVGRARPRALRGRRRRRRHVAQGREPAGRPGPDPVADAQGHGRPRARARARGRLRRALVRPLGRRRARPARADRAGRLARARDREDREGGGGRLARRDPRRDRRGDGRARRPRRRDRRRRGAAAAEADHHRRARAREAGDHGDADARVDDPPGRADAGRGQRHRERDPRRHLGADALGRDGGRRVPARVGRVHGPDRAGGRAEPRLPPRAAGARRRADGRPGDVERGLRPRRGAAGQGDPGADLHRPHGVGGRAPAAAAADHRVHPSRLRAAADGDRVGRERRS